MGETNIKIEGYLQRNNSSVGIIVGGRGGERERDIIVGD